jgi:hypothetical protein
MRELAMYPAAILTPTAVFLVAAALDWGDTALYTALIVAGIVVATILNLWIDAGKRRGSDPPSVG